MQSYLYIVTKKHSPCCASCERIATSPYGDIPVRTVPDNPKFNTPTRSRCDISKTNLLDKLRLNCQRHILSQSIGKLIRSCYIEDLGRSQLHLFSDEVVSDLDVLGPAVDHGIDGQEDRPLIVKTHGSWSRHVIAEFFTECPQPHQLTTSVRGRFILRFGRGKRNGRLTPRCPRYSSTCHQKDEARGRMPIITVFGPVRIGVRNQTASADVVFS